MHPSAMDNGEYFFRQYIPHVQKKGNPVTVVDIGSQNVNGSLKEVCPDSCEYIGVDFEEANGVDIVLDDPYSLPFESESVDVVVSSSCFEHSEMFWLSFLEVLRVLKPQGLFYLNAPSNGSFHRYPVDCWRFYPDSGNALITWAKRNHYNSVMLESYVSHQKVNPWNDFVAVFLKDADYVATYPERIIDVKEDIDNAFAYGQEEIFRHTPMTEDLRNLSSMRKQIHQLKQAQSK